MSNVGPFQGAAEGLIDRIGIALYGPFFPTDLPAVNR